MNKLLLDEIRCEIDKNRRMVARDRRIGIAHLALTISTVIIGAHPLTMSVPAQGATGRITSCKSEYDLCRRVRANPLRTKPNPAMIGSCEARYARAQQTGVWKSRFGGVRECSR
jgi:hypothetical protein